MNISPCAMVLLYICMFALTSQEFVYLFLMSSNLTIFSFRTNLTCVCCSSDTCDVYTLDYDSYYLRYECDGKQKIDTQYSFLDDGVVSFRYVIDINTL